MVDKKHIEGLIATCDEIITISKNYTKKEAFDKFIEIYQSGLFGMIFDKNTEIGKLACFIGIDDILK